jgi:hypothetical protein
MCTLIEFDAVGRYCYFYAPTRGMGGVPVNGTSFVAYSANTGLSKTLCALDDYSTETRKNVLNTFNHLPW